MLSLIVLAVLSISAIAFLGWVLLKQQALIQTLTNLAASKDLATYSHLQNLTQPPSLMTTETIPLDDQSVAIRLAEQYRSAGLDPNYAFNNDDPLSDFGGTDQFLVP